MRRLLMGLVVLLLALVAAAGASAADEPTGCRPATALLQQGRLEEATKVSLAVGAECAAYIKPLVEGQRSAAAKLVNQGRTSAQDSGGFGKLALALDADNEAAQQLAAAATPPASDSTLCLSAEQAAAGGEFARAAALYDALKEVAAAKKCREEGLRDLALLEQDEVATRWTSWATKDLMPTLVLLGIAFAVGVVLASAYRVNSGKPSAWFGAGLVVIVLTLFAMARARMTTGDVDSRLPVYVCLVLALLAAAYFGWALSNERRNSLPITIEVSGEGAKDEGFGSRVLGEVQNLGSGAPTGIFAANGTDVADSGVEAALGVPTNAVVKAVLAVWKAVLLRSTDRATIVVSADDASPHQAVVSFVRGRAAAGVVSVDGRDYCVDPQKPAPGELTASSRDVATGVAAALLLAALDWKSSSTAEARLRLYGATSAKSVALGAVASRRLHHGETAAAEELYRRAVDEDPDDLGAALGVVCAVVRAYPSAKATSQVVTDLAAIEERLEALTRHPWRLPLMWRIAWVRAVAVANGALAGQKQYARKTLQDSRVTSQLTLARRVLRPLLADPGSGVDTPEAVGSDAPLLRALQAAAKVADLGLRAGLEGASLGSDVVDELRRVPLTDGRDVQFGVACGLSLVYGASGSSTRRNAIKEKCVERIRLAGGVAPWRGDLLDDPFLQFVSRTKEFLQLQKEWRPPKGPYDGVRCFGAVTARIAAAYPTPAALAAALTNPIGIATVAALTEVRQPPLRDWAGAAVWLGRGQTAEVINLYQAAGLPDSAAVQQNRDARVRARLRDVQTLVGVESLPDRKVRAAMR